MVKKLKGYGVYFLKNTADILACGVAGLFVGLLIVGVYLKNPVSAESLDDRVDRVVCKLDTAVRKFLEK